MRGIVIGKGSAGLRHYDTLLKVVPEHTHLHIGSREWDSLSQYGTDAHQLLRDWNPSMIILASPASRHLDQLISVLSFGVPVLVEKPLLRSSREFDASEMVSSFFSIPIQIGYVLRHSRSFDRFQGLVRSHKSEQLRRVSVRAHSFLPSWRPNIDYRDSVSGRFELGGGALLELSHELDYVLNLFGDVKVSRVELGKSPLLEVDVETSCMIQAATASGATLEMSLDIGERRVERWCEVEWESGERLRWDIVNQTVTLWENSEVKAHEEFSLSRDDWYRRQLGHFLSVVSGTSRPLPGIDEGLHVMRVVDELRSASATI